MITGSAKIDNVPVLLHGVEDAIVNYVRACGQITGLDPWAHERGIDSEWARKCAHRAAEKGLITMTRIQNKQGQPYCLTPNFE
jgi:hypothetical protein